MTQHQDNIPKTLHLTESKRNANNKHHNLNNIGKFQQSRIGTQEKGQTQRTKELRKLDTKNIAKEFKNFWNNKKVREDDSRSAVRRAVQSGEKELMTLLNETTEKNIVNATEKIHDNTTEHTNTTGNKKNETSESKEVPIVSGLTSTDTKQQKRVLVDETDEEDDDAAFVYVVVGVAFCCIIAVLGVGFLLHRPSCSEISTPFSDCSPTFQSAKLAFSTTPVKQQRNSRQHMIGSFTQSKHSKDIVSKGSPRDSSNKMQEESQNNYSSAGGQLYLYKGNLRQESLIDIDGPEEDDEDDMIYECPGLAPHGEMEVANPFFLQKDFNLNHGDPHESDPCPINNNNNIKHGNISPGGLETK